MGDASVVSQGAEQMPQDPNMGGDPGMQDPMAQGSDPSMMGGADPGMDMGGNTGMEDPNMMGDMGNAEGNPDRQRKEIQKNIGKACADFRSYQGQDKEDLSKWVEGMLDSILDDSDAGIGDESEPDMEMPEDEPMPQMESVIFTKKQLNKLNEEFGIENLSSKKEDETKVEKKQNSKNKNTPFSNPKLNVK